MQNKYFKFLIIALAVAIIVPQVVLAAWWNPFSWGIWNRIFHFQQQSNNYNNLSGKYVRNGDYDPGELEISVSKNNEVSVVGNAEWIGNASIGSVNVGDIDGILKMNGNTGLYNDGNCKINFVFQSNKIVLKEKEIGLCGGMNVTFDGEYIKTVPVPVIMTIDPTADWKTYTNTQYGYQIKCPNQCKVVSNNPTGSFASANLLQIYYSADAPSPLSEFFSELSISIINQPYTYNGQIYNNIEDFVNLDPNWTKNEEIKSKSVVTLGTKTGLKISGVRLSEGGDDPMAGPFNEVLVMLPDKSIISVYYPDKFSEIASTFEFTK